MARIAGVNIPTNKRVVVALQYIHGIGSRRAQEIVAKVGIPAPRRVSSAQPPALIQGKATERPEDKTDGRLIAPVVLVTQAGSVRLLLRPRVEDELRAAVRGHEPSGRLIGDGCVPHLRGAAKV